MTDIFRKSQVAPGSNSKLRGTNPPQSPNMLQPLSRRVPALPVFKKRIVPCRRFLATTQLRSQQLPGEDGRTTHFGFETVAETQKEAKGKGQLQHHIEKLLTSLSRGRLLLSGIVV